MDLDGEGIMAEAMGREASGTTAIKVVREVTTVAMVPAGDARAMGRAGEWASAGLVRWAGHPE